MKTLSEANVAELKEFLTWAKDERIAKIKIGELEAEFSPLAFISEQTEEELKKLDEEDDEEDILYHSVNEG